MDGVLIVDPVTCQIIDANPFMSELWATRSRKVCGQGVFEIGLIKDQAASREMFSALQREGCVRYEDLPLKSTSGRAHEVEVVANLYLEDTEESSGPV